MISTIQWCYRNNIDPRVLLAAYWERLIAMENMLEKLERGEKLDTVFNSKKTIQTLNRDIEELWAIVQFMSFALN